MSERDPDEERAENEGRLRAKKLASNKKSSRSKSLDD